MVTALIVCATLVFLAVRFEKLASRLLSIKERVVTVTEEQSKGTTQPPSKREPLPQYLWITAMSESEKWARDEALKRMYELFEEHGNWDAVSRVVAPNTTRVE